MNNMTSQLLIQNIKANNNIKNMGMIDNVFNQQIFNLIEPIH